MQCPQTEHEERRPQRDAAEAAFNAATTKPAEPFPKRPTIAGSKEQVSLRIDHDILGCFQEGGPGWQDRINEGLRLRNAHLTNGRKR
jgi:uncharacterized protein (DUF4415 family)